MLKPDYDKLQDFLTKLKDDYESLSTSPLNFDTWFQTAFPILKAESKPKVYPYEVRIAPSSAEMFRTWKGASLEVKALKRKYAGAELKKQLSDLAKRIIVPKKTFIVEKPFMLFGQEIWFGDSTKGINLRFGDKNGDTKSPFGVLLGMEYVHMKMAGGTGMGKSVLQAFMLLCLFLEYPPWEISAKLFDFKLTEMVRFCNVVNTPHVTNVVASEDIEFVLTSVADSILEMLDRQYLFKEINVADIGDFRKEFNMVLPQLFDDYDEVQQYFLKEPKKNEVKELAFEKLARLGRALGAHEGIASQDMKGTLKPTLLSLFTVGVSVRCSEDVSNMVLGNKEASELRGKGKCVVNLMSGKIEDNTMVRIPYISGDTVTKYLIGMDTLCKENDIENKTDFFDESEIRYEEEFIDDIQRRYKLFGGLLLGDSVRMKRGKGSKSEFLFLKDGIDSENIVCISLLLNELQYMFRLLYLNVVTTRPKEINAFISSLQDESYFEQLDRMNISPVSDNTAFESAFNNIEIRRRILDIDNTKGVSNQAKYQKIEDDLNIAVKKSGMTSEAELYLDLLEERRKYSMSITMTSEMFPRINLWIFKPEGMVGVGRDTVRGMENSMKKLFRDGPLFGIRCYMFTAKLAENPIVSGLLGSITHRLLGSALVASDRNKLNAMFEIDETKLVYQNSKKESTFIKFKKYDLVMESLEEAEHIEEFEFTERQITEDDAFNESI